MPHEGGDDSSLWSEKVIDRLTVGAKIDVYDVFESMNRWSISNGMPKRTPVRTTTDYCATVRDTALLESLDEMRVWLRLQDIWYSEKKGKFMFKSYEDRNKFLLRWQG